MASCTLIALKMPIAKFIVISIQDLPIYGFLTYTIILRTHAYLLDIIWGKLLKFKLNIYTKTFSIIISHLVIV